MLSVLTNRAFRHMFAAQLVALDLIRAAVVLFLPFVTKGWRGSPRRSRRPFPMCCPMSRITPTPCR